MYVYYTESQLLFTSARTVVFTPLWFHFFVLQLPPKNFCVTPLGQPRRRWKNNTLIQSFQVGQHSGSWVKVQTDSLILSICLHFCVTVYHYDWNLQKMFWSLIGFEFFVGVPWSQACSHLVRLLCYLQTGRAQVWEEIDFYSYLGIKDHKIGSFVFYHLKILVTFLTFYRNSQNLAKFEMVLTKQIAGFLKV